MDVRSLRLAAVPLVADPLDLHQKSDPIWFSGDQPAARQIAALTLRPIGAIVVDSGLPEGYAAGTVLMRAIAGPQATSLESSPGETGEQLWCTQGAGKQAGKIACFADRDGDGKLDAAAAGMGERGNKPERLAVLGRFEPLPSPIGYRAVRPEERPSFAATFTNCARDHDRPRYAFAVKGSDPEIQTLLAAASGVDAATRNQLLYTLMKLGRGGSCKTADRAGPGDPLVPPTFGNGAAAARLSELTILVGPKEAGAPVTLLGMRRPDRLYRLVGTDVVPLAGTITDKQNALAVVQKYDRPVLALTGEVQVNSGERKPGDVLFTAGVRHGYLGVLTQETKIRTLLSSRSVPAGAVVYGIPMHSERVMTRNGIPLGPFNATRPTADDFHLTWCLPVEEGGKWTATCLPDQGGRYTILKGQTPAFEVSTMRYDAKASTNGGDVPVAQRDVSLERPLHHRFTLRSVNDMFAIIKQDTLYGDVVVNSRDWQVLRAKGKLSGLTYGDGAILIGEGAVPGTVNIRQFGSFKAGTSARVNVGVLNRDPTVSDNGSEAHPLASQDR